MDKVKVETTTSDNENACCRYYQAKETAEKELLQSIHDREKENLSLKQQILDFKNEIKILNQDHDEKDSKL